MTSDTMKPVRRRRFVAALLMALTILAWSLPSAAQEIAGVVRSSQGSATVTRGGNETPAMPGVKLLVGDVLNTGVDGSLGVIFRDDSTLSLGPDSSLVVREFLFSPAERKLGLVARLMRGTMSYLSGVLGKLAPESVRFETPVATIGIRGTRFAVKAGEPSSR